MKPKLKIVIFDGSFKTRPFINTVIKSLGKKHLIYVLGFDSELDEKIQRVRYVDLGTQSNKLNLFRRSLGFVFKNIFKKGGIKDFQKFIKLIVRFDSSGLKHFNFNKALGQIKPDIVHIQWISLLPYCETILNNNSYNVVLSQLGYQINVRPFVDVENEVYLKYLYPKITGFHSVSEAIKEKSDLLYASPSKIDKVIYSGFNFSSFPSVCFYEKQEILQLLSVGRPHWIKGYDYMIKACEDLKKNHVDFHYTIVGAKGNEELIYMINDLNLQEYITITDSLPQKEVYQLMVNSSLLVLPSLAEGIANVVIEAMAIGLPVLSTRCGGVVELITDNETGFLVPTRDKSALSKKIQDFNMLSLDRINTLRVKAREKVEKSHNIEKMTTDFEVLYYDCLQNH
ncbi:glycosyltransferase family 4 protein [uncultured Winogradskyella sp.]|uniref:glycosyltransferase family 4 protein n=1 Tax=uncultured Winogradskyella sp. TaxID=395353 RepID=UPI003511ACE8